MNKIGKIILILFSIIILCLSLVLSLVVNYVIPVEDLSNLLTVMNVSQNAALIWTLIFSFFAILAVIAIFLPTNDDDNKKGIKIKYEKGLLYLTKDTFENIALSVTKKYSGICSAKTVVVFSKEGIGINVYTYIYSDTVVSELTTKLQKDITDTIIRLTTAKVVFVNVKVKGIVTKNVESKTK